jgi:hypothetical protein
MGLCQEADLPVLSSWGAATLGAVYTMGRRIVDTALVLTQAMEQAVAMERGIDEALCSLSLGEACVLAGRLEDARACAERVLALACAYQEHGHQAYAGVCSVPPRRYCGAA